MFKIIVLFCSNVQSRFSLKYKQMFVVFSLWGNQITDIGAVCLAESLKINSTLQTLVYVLCMVCFGHHHNECWPGFSLFLKNKRVCVKYQREMIMRWLLAELSLKWGASTNHKLNYQPLDFIITFLHPNESVLVARSWYARIIWTGFNSGTNSSWATTYNLFTEILDKVKTALASTAISITVEIIA